ncbi:MAG: GNAT family N-acetyltransferase [Bacteroidales bacterium]|nr:GNAT family N-acetyltransferase [Bacteroidales bacterium]MBN2758617.1 GNAT family N-acetyltransferase [Bacteroidales bacterium]
MFIEIEGFSDLNNDKYQAFLDLRSKIYVEDLKYNKFHEFDGKDSKSNFYLLNNSGKYVAFLRYTSDKNNILIDRFGVENNFRRQAFGSLLLRYVIKDLLPSKKNIQIISSENKIGFFKIFGFQKTLQQIKIGEKELLLLELKKQ